MSLPDDREGSLPPPASPFWPPPRPDPAAASVGHRHRAFEGRREFDAALREALGRIAEASEAREIFLCDPDFADWPLGERSVVSLFDAWALSHRRLVVIACGFDDLARRHPRWVAWRQRWSHVVDCRLLGDVEASACPSLLHAPKVCTLRRLDVHRHRGVYSEGDEPVDRAVRAQFDALLQRSEPGFPVTTLGL